MGVIFFPQCIRAPEWAYSRSRGPYRVVQKHKTSNWGGVEWEWKPAQQMLLMFDNNNSHFYLCFFCVCTALTEPGQLPLGCHRAARLVWRSPGLPASFRAKPHGMSDGTQTLIMVFDAFSGTLRETSKNNNYMRMQKKNLLYSLLCCTFTQLSLCWFFVFIKIHPIIVTTHSRKTHFWLSALFIKTFKYIDKVEGFTFFRAKNSQSDTSGALSRLVHSHAQTDKCLLMCKSQ